ncbi:tyrosine-type recombinase/integrase [Cellulomonas sp. P24]|jgi:site-specific recombinase XerD|uniref:tyrosine-type recombinase/integrase n=1 Tax=Cellulomonas sp. P24 TaxID=2885206 RepID=UPI00216B4018|nr:tyrosine-type recombinase/integrase [Cellulomonas sp. P24]MCR6491753.1 tyrosine-type recombinase/integrase [Cellulomonas sp. P24]MCR6494426.1 tyrosine-type recombinase/integrase [Cellulomonas sp. P24]
MSAAVARIATAGDHDLLGDYVDHLDTLELSDRARRDRLRAARTFLTTAGDLTAWMDLPTGVRVQDLRRTGAWPFLVHAIGAGLVRLDLDLAGAKNLTGLAATIEARDPGGFTAARTGGATLGWTQTWVQTVLGECLAVILAWHGGAVSQVTSAVIDDFDAALHSSVTIPASTKKAYRCRLASLRQILFQAHIVNDPPRRRPWARSLEQRLDAVAMAEPIREVIGRYVRTRATVLRPKSVESLVNDLLPVAEYLTTHHRDLRTFADLRREHVEGFLAWNQTRGWRGQRAAAGTGRTISRSVAASTVLTLRNLLDDITAWGWDQAPARRLVFAADIPKLDRPLPRALAPDIDAALMSAVAQLDDPFARTGLTVLRGAGLRIGELLDLELDAVVDYAAAGTWLRVPLGKLATERMVPLDHDTLTALDQWAATRGQHRPVPHPRTGAPTDFFFTEHGHRLGATRLRNGLLTAARDAQLHGPGAQVLVVTPHQLRHTYATALANAGMSLQALMALLGHVTPEMTIRYATLASPTLRAAYDESIGKLRRQLTLTPVGRPIVPDKIAWLGTEMLKTRLGNGYCSRHQAQGACPYANICETCDHFTPAAEFTAALTDQVADIRALQTDAEARGWASEAARHDRAATAIEHHLDRLRPRTENPPALAPPTRAG